MDYQTGKKECRLLPDFYASLFQLQLQFTECLLSDNPSAGHGSVLQRLKANAYAKQLANSSRTETNTHTNVKGNQNRRTVRVNFQTPYETCHLEIFIRCIFGVKYFQAIPVPFLQISSLDN